MNWSHFARTTDYFVSMGFEEIETSPIVPMSSIMVTAPDEKYVLKDHDNPSRGLVGSAEQSFIHLMASGVLMPQTGYISTGPCFRYGDNGDEYHQEYFMKTELFMMGLHKMNQNTRTMYHFIDCALTNFSALAHVDSTLKVVPVGSGFDIELNGIEVGSYGIGLSPSGVPWVYGTAFAEPRFSQADKKRS